MQTQKADVPELRDEDDFRTKESPTVAGRVYALLRERILNMQLVPGTSMSEQEMASSLG
ncbi:MAG: GntR family transcriptional regulator, partial [Clostridiales bacterium]|nr:GntR family transcriptional regulator [Clostridiales bacterium]